jgi:hypothetical protein
MTLTPEEREVILTWNDAERRWHVYSDSLAQESAIRELAQRLGVTLGQDSVAIEFDLPSGRGIALPGIPALKPSEKVSPVAVLGEPVKAK